MDEGTHTFGFTITGDDQEKQLLKMILETSLDNKATLDALVVHVNVELARILHPDSMEAGLAEARRLAESFEKRLMDMKERVIGELAARGNRP